jgi:hypothetical protein
VLRRVLRSIVGVVTGYVVFVASNLALFQLTGQPPHRAASVAFMVGASAYGTAFALFGGYLSAWIAGRRPLLHAAAMAAILALVATGSLVATIGKGAIWTQICALALMTPAAVAGGWLRQRIASVVARRTRPAQLRETLPEQNRAL